jgi:hypothetical protein
MAPCNSPNGIYLPFPNDKPNFKLKVNTNSVIKNYIPTSPNTNYVVGTYKEDPAQYRTLNLNGNKLVKINEKGELNYDFSYVGIAGIKDFKLFFNNLETLIHNKHIDTSDVHAINNMLSEVDFYGEWVKENHWFDIGNTTELSKTKKAFHSSIEVLDKVDESIFFFDNFVIKFFSNSTVNKNRVARAYNLGDLVPEMINSTENFYKYKKAEGKLFSKSYIIDFFIFF